MIVDEVNFHTFLDCDDECNRKYEHAKINDDVNALVIKRGWNKFSDGNNFWFGY